jgi:hypothetical protein
MADAPVWARTFIDPDTGEFLEHAPGGHWYEVPVPPRRHRCHAQTRGVMCGLYVERCACAAIRTNGARRWTERNTTGPRRRRFVVWRRLSINGGQQ